GKAASDSQGGGGLICETAVEIKKFACARILWRQANRLQRRRVAQTGLARRSRGHGRNAGPRILWLGAEIIVEIPVRLVNKEIEVELLVHVRLGPDIHAGAGM